MAVTIDYYLSLNSPWTYIGSAPFAEIARRYGATVNVKPAKFGPIFEQTGGLPLPKRSPQRQAYRMMELKRWREVSGLPLNVQPKFFQRPQSFREAECAKPDGSPGRSRYCQNLPLRAL